MISESNEALPVFGKSRGKTVFRYNFEQVEQKTESGTQIIHRFNEVRLDQPIDRARLIDAVISERYTKADEIALINNKDLDSDAAREYEAYQAFRMQAKKWVDEAL